MQPTESRSHDVAVCEHRLPECTPLETLAAIKSLHGTTELQFIVGKQLTISIPHKHSQAEVKSRLMNALADARAKHPALLSSAQETWTGNRLDFRAAAMGQTITGDIEIEAEVVHLHLNLPWVLAMLANKIRPQIESEGRKLLEAPPANA